MLAAAQTGAGWALERFWRSYAGAVTGYLRLQGVAEPEDLTSEVFIGAFRSIGRFAGGEAAFRSWLFTIAHRKVIDARRAAGRRAAVTELDDAAAQPISAARPDDEVLRQLATERVKALCERLVADQRDVLLLRLVGGFTVDEVAAAIDKSPRAVKALQRRGLVALRKILEREGVPL
ncbi:MAG: sigma-70 family RNA polymerase sigma factor [Thermoleophilaceae bacterium]